MNKDSRIKNLLESKKRLDKKLKTFQKAFEEEKNNEDAWPGHDTNFLLQIQQDEQLVSLLLQDIENELKEVFK